MNSTLLRRRVTVLLGSLALAATLTAQTDSAALAQGPQRLQLGGDFRFRVEQDWNSRKADGTLRPDRFRMRYRFRLGVSKQLDRNFSVAGRLRTGHPQDQQGPHLTLGGNGGEFSLLSIGLEKAFVRYDNECFWAWAGKNDYPFWKEHELLWNDNVFPEGVAAGAEWSVGEQWALAPTSAYFVVRASANPEVGDASLFSNQLRLRYSPAPDTRLTLNAGSMLFRNLPDAPDGRHDALMNYHLLTASAQYRWKQWTVGYDYYHNCADYRSKPEVDVSLTAARTGQVAYLLYRRGRGAGAYHAGLYLARIGKYSIVDYFSQNDWGRWDYSGLGATGSRLSNFRGLELRAGYQLTEAIDLVGRLYSIASLAPAATAGAGPETGERFRIDANVKF